MCYRDTSCEREELGLAMGTPPETALRIFPVSQNLIVKRSSERLSVRWLSLSG